MDDGATTPQKPRGRPPLDADDPSVGINVRLPSRQYDALHAQATRERVTLPELVRRRLRAADVDE